MALTDDLISYWRMDEASGNALDAHGSNTLTDVATVGSTTGKINNARDFEFSNAEFFWCADTADLSTGDIDFTIAAWVNAEAFGGNRVIAAKYLGGSANNREWQLWYINGSARFELRVSPDGAAGSVVTRQATTLGAPSTGTWYHIVAWHDSVNNLLGIAVNGGAADTSAHTTGVFTGDAAFSIGEGSSSSVGTSWDGLIDEVGFWKRVLTSQERTDLYNSGNGLAYPFTTSTPQHPAGVVAGVSTVSAALTVRKLLAAVAASVSSVAGALTTSKRLAAAVSAQSTVAAALTGGTEAGGGSTIRNRGRFGLMGRFGFRL
jgi:hypothetical protein